MRRPQHLEIAIRLCVGLIICIVFSAARQVPAQATAQKESTFFTFEKKGLLFDKPAGMGSPGPYYTTLVHMDGVKDFPFEYALYFSTDHHNAEGGIWLYVCNGAPSEPRNWKSYDRAVADGDFGYLPLKPEKNPIFVDRTQGRQTETPHANIIGGAVYMTYHNSGVWGGQSTLLATSPDGVNFTRINGDEDSAILRADTNGGHTGYFRWAPNPFPRVDYKYVGYSLHGGGDDYHSAMWGSNDAVDWRKLQVFTPMEGYAMADGDMIMIWHEINPNAVEQIGDDEFVLLSAGGNRASGGAARVVELYEIFLAGDGKTLTRRSRRVVPAGRPGAPDSEEAAEPTMVRIGDTWHLIYVGASWMGGVNSVMSATGTFNPGAPPSPELAPEDMQRNFFE